MKFRSIFAVVIAIVAMISCAAAQDYPPQAVSVLGMNTAVSGSCASVQGLPALIVAYTNDSTAGIYQCHNGVYAQIGVVTGVQLANANAFTNKNSVTYSNSSATISSSFLLLTSDLTLTATTIAAGGNSVVGTRGSVTLPTGKTFNSGYVYGSQGKVYINGTSNTQSGGGIIAGTFGQLDMTGGTVTNTGLTAPLAGDITGTGVGGAVANVHGVILTNSTSTVAGSAIHVGTTSGGWSNLFSIDDSTNTIATTSGSPGTCTGHGYINVTLTVAGTPTAFKLPLCQ